MYIYFFSKEEEKEEKKKKYKKGKTEKPHYLIASMRDDGNSLLCYRNMFDVCKMFCARFLNASQKHK